MTTQFWKTAWARTLPSLLLAFDFLAVLAVSLIVLWLVVVVPVAALAQDASPQQAAGELAPESTNTAPQIIHASTVDIDRDGQYDRAVLVRNPRTGDADLYVYLRAGGLTPMPARDFTLEPATGQTKAIDPNTDLSTRRPDIVKAGIADARILDFEKNNEGSLIIQFGCGGCSNDTATRLTVVHRSSD